MKSAQDKILQHFKDNPMDWFPSGELQRIPFRNKDGTTATPRTIVRRLQELENEKEIAVGYDGNNAKYRHLPDSWKPRYKRAAERAHKYSNDYWFPVTIEKPKQAVLEFDKA